MHVCTHSSGICERQVVWKRKHPHLKETTADFAGSTPPVVLVEMVRSPGWWYTYPSESYEFVSWDDEIPNIWEKTCSKPPTILIIPSTFFAG